MLIDAILPPAGRDRLDVLAVAGSAFALYAVQDVLPILQFHDLSLELLEFRFDSHSFLQHDVLPPTLRRLVLFL